MTHVHATQVSTAVILVENVYYHKHVAQPLKVAKYVVHRVINRYWQT